MDVAEVSLSTTGEPVIIDVSAYISGLADVEYFSSIDTTAQSEASIRILRNGTVLEERKVMGGVGDEPRETEYPGTNKPSHDPNAVERINGRSVGAVFEDTSPPAGSTTYTFQIKIRIGSFLNSSFSSFFLPVNGRAIRAVEFKR